MGRRERFGVLATTRITEPDPDGAGPLAAPQTNFGYDAAGS